MMSCLPLSQQLNDDRWYTKPAPSIFTKRTWLSPSVWFFERLQELTARKFILCIKIIKRNQRMQHSMIFCYADSSLKQQVLFCSEGQWHNLWPFEEPKSWADGHLPGKVEETEWLESYVCHGMPWVGPISWSSSDIFLPAVSQRAS